MTLLRVLMVAGLDLSVASVSDLPLGADRHMNVIALQHPAFDVGGVALAFFQPVDGDLFVAEGLQKRKREAGRIKRVFRQQAQRFFDFDCVHFLLLRRRAFHNPVILRLCELAGDRKMKEIFGNTSYCQARSEQLVIIWACGPIRNQGEILPDWVPLINLRGEI